MRTTILGLVATLVLGIGVADSDENSKKSAGTIVVTFDGVQPDKNGKFAGTVNAELLLSSNAYATFDARIPRPKSLKESKLATLQIEGGIAKWIIEDVPYGEYAIVAYHDRNMNHILDTNLVGLNTEDYGISRGARVFLKMPSWDKVKFRVSEDSTEIRITVK